MQENKIQYWATLTGRELGDKLVNKIENYYSFVNHSGLLTIWRKVYTELNTIFTEGSNIKTIGKNGEFKKIKINNLRSFKTNLMSLVSEVRPKFTAQATNTDFQSQSQTKLARNLLEYYLTEKRLEIVLKDVISTGLETGRGFIGLEWNPNVGEIISVNPDNNKPLYEGDVRYTCYSDIDVIRNVYKQSENENWVILRKKVNKYDLIASYPEFAEQIEQLSYDFNDLERNIYVNHSTMKDDEQETVALYEFRHNRTESLPEGRLVIFLDEETILIDSPLPYDNLAVFSFDTAPLQDITFGYSVLWDLLPIFEAYNKLTSSILTNQASLGNTIVGMPLGANIDYHQLGEGLSIVEYNMQAGRIEPINLLQTPAEIFQFVNSLEGIAQKISGINSVRRGDNNSLGANASGSAYALFVAQSISFNVNLQHSWNMLLEQVGSSLINILKSFASTKRVASIAGVNNSYSVQEFSKDDLSLVQRVKVQVGNPLSDTLAGKLSIASDLMQKGALTAQEYIQVLTTGNLDTVLDFEESQNQLIEQENEALLRNEDVIALVTDNHLLHKQGHLTLLNNPASRRDPDLVAKVLAHISEHDKLGQALATSQGNISNYFATMNQPQGQINAQPNTAMNQESPSLGGARLPNMPKIAGSNQRLQPANPVPGTAQGNIQ